MNLLVEILSLWVKCLWLWLVAIFRAVVPVSLQPHKDISGWVVLVTGAGSGIGQLLALRFAGLGCRVVLWDIVEAANETTAKLVREAKPGAEVKAYTVDLAKRENVYKVAEQVKKDFGDVDILINNAGIISGDKLLDAPDEPIVKTMEVNTISHFWTVKAFLPGMLTKNSGHVVTVSSSAGLFSTPGMADYCASKFSAVGFDECLRREIIKMKKTGVKTTVVCPTLIDTGMFEGFKYRFSFLIKTLEPAYVADKIVDAVLTDQPMLILPKSMYTFLMLKGILPVAVTDAMVEFTGILNCMDDYVGRKNK
ncbi:retinol dehydrogenase 10 [Plakobranchus ocellatus]|uniref:Retinol dehydrogenase 10 n=1 Tax=Plakobranchus ocellatus TaxID=259542 RepID=A0AAV3Z2K1_9GAST|nr:retinol dehydrogenase 10 [Plakobranchus ocellatus]